MREEREQTTHKKSYKWPRTHEEMPTTATKRHVIFNVTVRNMEKTVICAGEGVRKGRLSNAATEVEAAFSAGPSAESAHTGDGSGL